MLLPTIFLGRSQTTSALCPSWCIYVLDRTTLQEISQHGSETFLLCVILISVWIIFKEACLVNLVVYQPWDFFNFMGIICLVLSLPWFIIFLPSSIYYFCVTQNQLHGSLPPDVNSFTGTIPVSLSNASQLRLLDFAQNGLTGTVPQNLASLQGLVRINFDQNRLRNGKDGDLNFLSFLSNCTSLEVLGLAQNNFGGVLPSSIANLSTQLLICIICIPFVIVLV